MEEMKLITAEDCDRIDEECAQKLVEAKEFAMESDYPDAEEYLKYVYVD